MRPLIVMLGALVGLALPGAAIAGKDDAARIGREDEHVVLSVEDDDDDDDSATGGTGSRDSLDTTRERSRSMDRSRDRTGDGKRKDRSRSRDRSRDATRDHSVGVTTND